MIMVKRIDCTRYASPKHISFLKLPTHYILQRTSEPLGPFLYFTLKYT